MRDEDVRTNGDEENSNLDAFLLPTELMSQSSFYQSQSTKKSKEDKQRQLKMNQMKSQAVNKIKNNGKEPAELTSI